MRFVYISFCCAIGFLTNIFAQEDSLSYHVDLKPVKIIKPNSTYAYYLKKIQKLYPYALYAADVIHQLDDDIAVLDKKRQIKKVSKEMQKELFDKFDYMIRDLYSSEGRILMKLINRETGMTVDEIIRKYRGKLQATVYTTMAKMFHQDLKLQYHPKGEDWMIEKVIRDIKADAVYFDPQYKEVTKSDYKAGMKVYRAEKKESRQRSRENKKKERIEKRSKKSEK